MAVCFQLLDKTTQEPTPLAQIDDRICEHLGVESHPKMYHAGWYDTIGFCLACGDSFDKIRTTFEHDDEYQKIINFLDEHYTPKSWCGR